MGADIADYHIAGVGVSRDMGIVKDLIAVKDGDGCPKCGAPLSYAKGIEVGHIFQLGTRYSEPLDAKFLDKNGKAQPFIMGTYGIGVSRLLAAIIEQWGDDKGCIWPLEIAPYKLVIIISNIKDEAQRQTADELYLYFKAQNIAVLLDDRDERYGHKMADFELLGHPYAVVVGKNLADGVVEIVERKTLNKEICKIENVKSNILNKMTLGVNR
jgi:prolyl-tRNA synthetase